MDIRVPDPLCATPHAPAQDMRRLLHRRSITSDYKSSGQKRLVDTPILLELRLFLFFHTMLERLNSSMVAEIIDLEAAILAAIDGRQPNPRRDGQSCARAFTEKLRILTQHLTTPTDDPLPRFLRIARCRSALASLPFRTAASRDTNRDVVLVLALFANDNPCAPTQRRCLRFKYSSVHEFKSVSEPPVHELSAANECILRFKCSATAASSNSFSTPEKPSRRTRRFRFP